MAEYENLQYILSCLIDEKKFFALVGMEVDEDTSRYIDILNNKRFVIWEAERQEGKTTKNLVHILHMLLMCPNKNIVVATSGNMFRYIINSVVDRYNRIPEILVPKIKKVNGSELWLENGSKLTCVTYSPNSLRGRTVDHLYCDEMDFHLCSEEFLQSAFPTCCSTWFYFHRINYVKQAKHTIQDHLAECS